MKRVLVILNLVLLAAVVWLWVGLSVERSDNRRLEQALAKANQSVRELQAAQENTNDLHEACRARINEMTRSFNSAADQLIAMSMRVRELEAKAKAMSDLMEGTAPSGSDLGAATVARDQASAARLSVPPGSRRFDTLYGTNHQVLGTNLVFSGVYGRRVAFKEAGSSRRVAFDVDTLDPAVLATLEINPETQKALRVRQERAWQQAEATSLALAAADEQRRKEQQAARAEAERQRQEQLQAQAAREAADAGAQAGPAPGNPAGQPPNVYLIDPYGPAPPVPYRVPPWWWRPRPW